MSDPFALEIPRSDALTVDLNEAFIAELAGSDESMTSEEFKRLLKASDGIKRLAKARGCNPIKIIHQGRHFLLTDPQAKCLGCALTLDTGTRCPSDAGVSTDCEYKAKNLKQKGGLVWNPTGRAPSSKAPKKKRSCMGSPNKK